MPLGFLGAFDADDERASTFQRDDLYKMHAYRDAITAAVSAWVLYPGTEVKFYRAEAKGEAFMYRGVGAVPTRPGRADLDALVKRLVFGDAS